GGLRGGAGGGGAVRERALLPEADRGGQDDLRGPLLHRQPAGDGQAVRRLAAWALAGRELPALAAGRDVPGGRQPHPRPQLRPELRPAAAGPPWAPEKAPPPRAQPHPTGPLPP